MASLNKIVLVTEVLSNPESKVSTEGTPLSRFKASISGGYSQQNASIDVVCWQKVAEGMASVKIGDKLIVEGKIQVRSYEDQAGGRKWVTEVVANFVRPLDGSVSAQTTQGAVASGASDLSGLEEIEGLPEDELPF